MISITDFHCKTTRVAHLSGRNSAMHVYVFVILRSLARWLFSFNVLVDKKCIFTQQSFYLQGILKENEKRRSILQSRSSPHSVYY